MESLTLLSPAKINFFLQIKGKRDDGYHLIESLMIPISLYDEICISRTDDKIIRFSTDSIKLQTEKNNLITKAAQAFFNYTGTRSGLNITLKKNIPIGGGLGGGSSNAAATLKGLNQLLKTELDLNALAEIGLTLGADVPFFIYNTAALAEGIGEKLIPVIIKEKIYFIIVYPNFQVSTAAIYKKVNLKLTKRIIDIRLLGLEIDYKTLLTLAYNELESITAGENEEIRIIKERLKEAGAEVTLMSGSGSSVFGMFRNEKSACSAYEKIASGFHWAIFITHNI